MFKFKIFNFLGKSYEKKYFIKKLSFYIILYLNLLVLTTSHGFCTSIPPYINYQGKLMDQNTSNPIIGLKSITFSLYDVPIGGLPIYYQSQDVNIVNGNFSAMLGKGVGYYDGNVISDGIPSEVFTEHSACFLGIKIEDAQTEMHPRQFISSAAYAFKAKESEELSEGRNDYLVPRGGIIMWSGTINSIPNGWALCDGTNGTPNLYDRFIVSPNPGEDPGSMGGASSYNLTVAQLPSHSHSGSTSSGGSHSHSGTTNATGNHSHKHQCEHKNTPYGDNGNTRNPGKWHGPEDSSALGSWDNTDSAGSHSHSLTTSSSGSHSHSFTTDAAGSGASIDNRPNYYALAFIMKL